MARNLVSMLKMLGRLISGTGVVSLVLAGAPVRGAAQTTPAQPSVQQGSTNNHVSTGPKRRSAKKNKKAQKEVVETPPPPPPPPPTPEQMPAQVPEVIYSQGLLTINAQNSTMNDVLAAVRRVTGATIEKPPLGGSDRVVAHLGPGQPKDVLTSLLNGSRYDYVIVGPMGHPGGVQRIILTARASMPSQSPIANAPGQPMPPNAQNPAAQPQQQENSGDTEDMTVPEQPAPEQEQPEPEVEQPQPQQQQVPPQGYPQPTPQEQQPQAQPPQGQEDQGQQPHVKSPEELLRELQQMQKQQQDQQQQNQQQPPPQ